MGFTWETEEEKSRGRLVEVNNGRAAMLGLMAVLSESKGLVVPPLDYIDGFPKYSGDIMVPFEGSSTSTRRSARGRRRSSPAKHAASAKVEMGEWTPARRARATVPPTWGAERQGASSRQHARAFRDVGGSWK